MRWTPNHAATLMEDGAGQFPLPAPRGSDGSPIMAPSPGTQPTGWVARRPGALSGGLGGNRTRTSARQY
jgi:hypothetical protein